jgi:hypothetical protein
LKTATTALSTNYPAIDEHDFTFNPPLACRVYPISKSGT